MGVTLAIHSIVWLPSPNNARFAEHGAYPLV
jgi:hypothetical protein